MSNVGPATRRATLRTPAVASLIGAVVGIGLVAVPVDPAEAAGALPVTAVAVDRPNDPGPDDRGTAEAERRGVITGVVVGVDGRRHLGAIVRLHRAATDGEPEVLLRPAFTGVDGRYRFDDLAPGCYRIVVDAPAGTSFADGADTEDHVTCLDEPGASDAGSTGPAAAPGTGTETGPSAELRSVTNPEGEGPATPTIEIVHVGHHLGQLAPSTMELQLAGATVEAEVGGWPRVVTAIEAARPSDAPESTITVNTGGVLAGSELAHLFGGAADAALLDRVCFDYLAPSPHDRARVDEWATFRRFLDDGHCSTTVLEPGAAATGGSSSTDAAVALHPVGAGSVALVAVGSASEAAATRARLEALGDAGPSTIVVLSGLGLTADRVLAGQLPAIDAIVGSGPDSLLGGLDDLGLSTLGPYPDRTINAEGDPVCLGHAGDRARAIGVLRIEVDAAGRVVNCGGRIEFLVGDQLAIDAESIPPAGAPERPTRADIDRALAQHPGLTVVTPDPATSRSLDRWTGVLDVLLDDPVATVTDDRCHTRIPGRSVGFLCGTDDEVTDTSAPRSDVQQLVTDALRHRAGELGQPAIALIDSATVHGGIEAGHLTVAEAYDLLPTGPTLSLVELTGAELSAAIVERLATAVAGSPGAYPHTSGLRFSADLSRSGRESVGPIEVLDDDGGWRSIDPTTRYRIVTTDRLLADEEGSRTLFATSGTVTTTTVGTAEALLDYVDDVLDGFVGSATTPEGRPVSG